MINTWSKFFYNFEVTEENKFLSFSEGGPEIVATVPVGRYAPTKGLIAVAAAMSEAGGLTYSVTVDRATRLITISSDSNFELLVATGSTLGNSIFPSLGFTLLDRTGAANYQSNLKAFLEYFPQFKLQDYVPSENYQRSIDATVRKASTGEVEVVRFGIEKLVQMNMRFITDRPMDGRLIRNNPNGLADLRSFMQWLTSKAQVEFMPDLNQPNTYETLILERTSASANGTEYKLDELYDQNLPDFYETGRMVFRVIE